MQDMHTVTHYVMYVVMHITMIYEMHDVKCKIYMV